MAITRSTLSPTASTRSMACRELPPVVTTSSTITTRCPDFDGPFNIATATMSFRFFAYDESLEGQSSLSGQRHDGSRNRIGADRHSSDRIRQIILEQLENTLSNQVRAAAVERHLTAVEVIRGLFA